jgi:hypothetical protein
MEKKRLQFDFTQDALEELDQLQRATGLPSRAELIRHSLRLLQWIVDQTQNKKATLLIEKDGKIRELVLLPSIGSGIEGATPTMQKTEELVSRD